MTVMCWALMALAMTGVASSDSSLQTLLGTPTGANKWVEGLDNDLAEPLVDILSRMENTTGVAHSRQARQLISFPADAVMEFYFKLIVPYWTYGSAKTKGDYRFEVSIELPDSLRRRKRSLSTERSSMYIMLSDFLSKAGLDGETCVLRAVCEIGEKPLDEYGLFGEFINLIFAPGYHSEDHDHQDEIQAEEYGRSFGNCWSAFPDCPVSMREMLYDFFMNNSEMDNENEI